MTKWVIHSPSLISNRAGLTWSGRLKIKSVVYDSPGRRAVVSGVPVSVLGVYRVPRSSIKVRMRLFGYNKPLPRRGVIVVSSKRVLIVITVRLDGADSLTDRVG